MAITHNPGTQTPPVRKVWSARTDDALEKILSVRDLLIRPVKPGEMMFFTSQLALMLEVGTPLITALDAIRGEVGNPTFGRILNAVAREIEEGRQFSESVSRHHRIFDKVFVSMAKAGETGGFLMKILDRLVHMQEKRQALLQQLRSALTYPVVLTLLGFGVVIFIMMGVLPKFTAIFEGKESILPWSTRFLMAASASLSQHWPLYLVGTIAAVFGTLLWSRTRMGGAIIDRFLISSPVVNALSNRIYTSEMLRTLGYLLESNVPLVEALQVTRPTVRNRYYRRFIDSIIAAVSQGGRFALPFGQNPHIPGTVKQMVAVGEEVGQLPTVMRRLSRFYDMEVESALKKFVAAIEPVALIFLGGVIGLIVSSIVLPLFRLSHALH